LMNDYPGTAPYRFMPNPPPRGLLHHPKFVDGLREIERRNLTFDAALFPNQFRDFADVVGRVPNLPIVLNHCGQLVAMDLDAAGRKAVFDEWRSALNDLARRPNVFCKIGGLGLPFFGLGLETRTDPIGYRELATLWAPFVEATIEIFGVGRCLMESNYPIDGRAAGFVPLWNALKYVVRSSSSEEKHALFHDNAARVYRINLP
jgi:L-fuconolactonase